jgi:hypothetical protein
LNFCIYPTPVDERHFSIGTPTRQCHKNAHSEAKVQVQTFQGSHRKSKNLRANMAKSINTKKNDSDQKQQQQPLLLKFNIKNFPNIPDNNFAYNSQFSSIMQVHTKTVQRQLQYRFKENHFVASDRGGM